jgi:O-succinylbenzoate synthase
VRIEAVELRLLSLHLFEPHRSSAGQERDRPVVIVRVMGEDGDGWGECGALARPSYSEEYATGAYDVLQRFLVPALLARPGPEAQGATGTVGGPVPAVPGHHMAKAALQMAVLDARLRAGDRSLAEHLGVTANEVAAGGVAGLAASPQELLERVGALAAAGYRRIKVKIAPGRDVGPLRAVRTAFPELPLQADANGAYARGASPTAVPDALRALDELGLLCLEQPFAADDLVAHAALARALSTPVCLDESLTSLGRLEAALALGACRVACVKPAMLGGLDEAVAAHDRCLELGAAAWVGGMLETGLGRAANAALAALPGFTMVGDIGAGRRFDEDDPFGVVGLVDGRVPLHRGPGVGPAPDPALLRSVTIRSDLVTAPAGVRAGRDGVDDSPPLPTS